MNREKLQMTSEDHVFSGQIKTFIDFVSIAFVYLLK